MLGRTDSRGRLVVLLVAFVLAAGTLIARLGWWQVVRRTDLTEAAQRQIFLREEVPAQRGAIYDRSGTVVLAETVTRDRLIANAAMLKPSAREALTTILADALQLDEAGIAAVRSRLDSEGTYVLLARDVEPVVSEAVRERVAAAAIPGISFESESKRLYPQSGGGPETSLAAHLLGFVNRDGEGQYGVEQAYQELLAGRPSIVESDRDANGQAIDETRRTIDAGLPGTDLSLTIDAGLQLALEQEVIQAWVADGARSVSATVMDPYTGALYAAATFPSYDANAYAKMAATDPGRFVDPIVSEVYEPGSVFKMLTVIASLESKTTSLQTEIDDTGTLKLDGGRTRIDDADRKARGLMRVEDGIAFSRNVVAAKMALRLAPTTDGAAAILYETWRRLGFGALTGVDIAGEVAGLVRDPAARQWREIDLANGSFGQGVAVTPLQLAVAYAAMVNGGTLVTPYVVREIGGAPVVPKNRGSVLDASLSPVLADLMKRVVSIVPFYRDRTLIPGYTVGGKTGTAQIWDSQAGNWKTGVFDFSFVGFIGRRSDRPDLIVGVRINEGRPTIRRVGQLEMPVMSFELFRRIATDAMAIPGLLPELPPEEAPAAKVNS